jgi:hypothetical protein
MVLVKIRLAYDENGTLDIREGIEGQINLGESGSPRNA